VCVANGSGGQRAAQPHKSSLRVWRRSTRLICTASPRSASVTFSSGPFRTISSAGATKVCNGAYERFIQTQHRLSGRVRPAHRSCYRRFRLEWACRSVLRPTLDQTPGGGFKRMTEVLQCPYCALRFSTRSELEQHKALDHPHTGAGARRAGARDDPTKRDRRGT
jgi:hypothetical protein